MTGTGVTWECGVSGDRRGCLEWREADGQMDRRADGHLERQMERRRDRWMKGMGDMITEAEGWVGGLMERKDRGVGGWMEGWMEGWAEGWMKDRGMDR